MQSGTHGDAVNARVQCRGHAHLQGLTRAVHGELFHAVDKNQPVTLFGLHGGADVAAGRLGQNVQVKLDPGFVGVVDVVFVKLGFVLDKTGVESAVRHIVDHGI